LKGKIETAAETYSTGRAGGTKARESGGGKHVW